MAGAIRDPLDLLERLRLSPERWGPGAQRGHGLFPVFVPEPYLARIEPGNPDDPLLRQVLPLDEEAHPVPGFTADPLDEATSTATPGLIRKYRTRALLVMTGACAINCRYCFRRLFPYNEHKLGSEEQRQALDFLERHTEINEVILSGGDPLVTSDRSLAHWVSALQPIKHIRRLRIHTRLPVVIPQRVTDDLLDLLEQSRFQSVIVLHINHPAEIDTAVIQACRSLKGTGATLLNQSVLLNGINDSAATLSALSERLFEAGVLPYYLHSLDPVEGAAHFQVPVLRARMLMSEMLEMLPGFLVPKLVREFPGRSSKTPLDLHLE